MTIETKTEWRVALAKLALQMVKIHGLNAESVILKDHTGRWPTDMIEIACETARNAELPKLPPDPDGQNNDRAKWAQEAIAAFMEATGTDLEDALPDLLCDLMHWADRNGQQFGMMLERARENYKAETAEG